MNGSPPSRDSTKQKLKSPSAFSSSNTNKKFDLGLPTTNGDSFSFADSHKGDAKLEDVRPCARTLEVPKMLLSNVELSGIPGLRQNVPNSLRASHSASIVDLEPPLDTPRSQDDQCSALPCIPPLSFDHSGSCLLPPPPPGISADSTSISTTQSPSTPSAQMKLTPSAQMKSASLGMKKSSSLSLRTARSGSTPMRVDIPPRGDHDSGSRRDGGEKIADYREQTDDEMSAEFRETERRSQKLIQLKNVCSEIMPGLFVSGESVSRNKETLRRNGITHIINCAATACSNPFEKDGDFLYVSLYLYDSAQEDIASSLPVIVHYIASVLGDFNQSKNVSGSRSPTSSPRTNAATKNKSHSPRKDKAEAPTTTSPAVTNNGAVLLHCHQGVSRSCAFAIAYIMWKNRIEFNAAFQLVKSKRGICSPNSGFIGQLLEWQKLLFQPVPSSGLAFAMTLQTSERAPCSTRPTPFSIGSTNRQTHARGLHIPDSEMTKVLPTMMIDTHTRDPLILASSILSANSAVLCFLPSLSSACSPSQQRKGTHGTITSLSLPSTHPVGFLWIGKELKNPIVAKWAQAHAVSLMQLLTWSRRAQNTSGTAATNSSSENQAKGQLLTCYDDQDAIVKVIGEHGAFAASLAGIQWDLAISRSALTQQLTSASSTAHQFGNIHTSVDKDGEKHNPSQTVTPPTLLFLPPTPSEVLSITPAPPHAASEAAVSSVQPRIAVVRLYEKEGSNWTALRDYDYDDLDPDSIFALYHGVSKSITFWIGANSTCMPSDTLAKLQTVEGNEGIKEEDAIKEQLHKELLSSLHSNERVQSGTFSVHVEKDGKESDLFWERYESGF